MWRAGADGCRHRRAAHWSPPIGRAAPRRAPHQPRLPPRGGRDAEHIGNDLCPQRRARSTPDEIDFGNGRTRGGKRGEIVAHGKSDAFEHGLNDVATTGRAAQPRDGAGRGGVIERRALAVEIREKTHRAWTRDRIAERGQQVGIGHTQYTPEPRQRCGRRSAIRNMNRC